MDRSFLLPKAFYENTADSYPSHYIRFIQSINGIEENENRIVRLPDNESTRIGAVEILKEQTCYCLKYRYDFFGLTTPSPVRGNYDRTGTFVYLNETAMVLNVNEYGRIIYNGRFVDRYSGNWYYKFEIVNVINTSGQMPLDAFTSRSPDKLYQQIATLR